MKVLIYCIIGLIYLGQVGVKAQSDDLILTYASKKIPLYEGIDNRVIVTSKDNNKKPKNLSFSVDNGEVNYIKGTNQLIIIPKSASSSLTLTIKNKKGKVIVERKYDVLPIPTPSIVLANESNQELSIENPIFKGQIVQLKTLSDPLFTALSPESSYQVKAIEVRQFRGGRALANNKQDSSTIDLNEYEGAEGDGFQIKITKVVLVDKSGKNHEIPVNRKSRYVSFFIK